MNQMARKNAKKMARLGVVAFDVSYGDQ